MKGADWANSRAAQRLPKCHGARRGDKQLLRPVTRPVTRRVCGPPQVCVIIQRPHRAPRQRLAPRRPAARRRQPAPELGQRRRAARSRDVSRGRRVGDAAAAHGSAVNAVRQPEHPQVEPYRPRPIWILIRRLFALAARPRLRASRGSRSAGGGAPRLAQQRRGGRGARQRRPKLDGARVWPWAEVAGAQRQQHAPRHGLAALRVRALQK